MIFDEKSMVLRGFLVLELLRIVYTSKVLAWASFITFLTKKKIYFFSTRFFLGGEHDLSQKFTSFSDL